MKFALLAIVGLLLECISGYGQQINSLIIINNAYSNESKAESEQKGALLTFYKKFISSQDGPNCMFTPSCSVYAAKKLSDRGWFIGWLAASDRLLRCTPLSDEEYEMNETGQYLDP